MPGRPKFESKSGKVITLFSGIGGLSLGMKWAGFDVHGFVEIEKSASRIYKLNFPDVEELGSDILKIKDETVFKWKKRFGEIDLICGGPPCQGFSLAGKRNEADYRNKLYREYVRIAEIIKPKVVLMENVRLLSSMRDKRGEFFLEHIMSDFRKIGYNVNYHLVNAANYGIPQSRERIFFLGIRKDLNVKPDFPKETHGKNINLFTPKKHLTFRDACKDLQKLESGQTSKKDPLHWAIVHLDHVIKWLEQTPEGKSAHENEDVQMRPPSGYNTTYKRVFWNEPCSTISTNFNMISGSRNIHPRDMREHLQFVRQ